MAGYGFLRSLKMIFFLGLFVLVGLLICGFSIYHQFLRESNYRGRFGAGWRAEYERDFGSLTIAHVKVAVTAVGMVTICGLLTWLYKILRSPSHSTSRHGTRAKSGTRRFRSRLDRINWCRRNAVLGIYFGLIGIISGAFLAIFRLGIFPDRGDEVVLGMFVFIGGYLGVITGCWYWFKAKEWNEAIVFIGLMPLAILFIPFVRLILLAAPAILPAGMVMMPLILIVVVFVLPDKSGASRRKPGWDSDRSGRRRFESVRTTSDEGRPKPPTEPEATRINDS